MKKIEEKLLRQYISVLLKEDDTGGMGYAPAMTGGMGAPNYGSSLKSVFIDPFLDAGKVIKASSSKVLLRMKTLAKVAIETILTSTIPFLQSNYELIFKNEKEALAKLHEKYKKNFEAVDKAFTNDFMLVSFMISPEAFITANLISKAPELAIDIFETLAVGNEGLVKYFEDLKKRFQFIGKELDDDISNYKIDDMGALARKNARGPYMTKAKRDLVRRAGLVGTNIAKEAFEPERQDKTQLLLNALKDQNIVRQLSETPLAKAMKADAIQLVNRLENGILTEAKKVMSANSIYEIQNLTQHHTEIPGIKELEQNDKAALESAVLSQVKSAMKQFYVETLKKEIALVESKGVDSANLYIKALHDTLTKISAL